MGKPQDCHVLSRLKPKDLAGQRSACRVLLQHQPFDIRADQFPYAATGHARAAHRDGITEDSNRDRPALAAIAAQKTISCQGGEGQENCGCQFCHEMAHCCLPFPQACVASKNRQPLFAYVDFCASLRGTIDGRNNMRLKLTLLIAITTLLSGCLNVPLIPGI